MIPIFGNIGLRISYSSLFKHPSNSNPEWNNSFLCLSYLKSAFNNLFIPSRKISKCSVHKTGKVGFCTDLLIF